jgi:hypothetical protein
LPRVVNVFHDVPHDVNGGSGPPSLQQVHRLEDSGTHSHFGHLIRLCDSDSARFAQSVVTAPGVLLFFNSCQSNVPASVPVVHTISSYDERGPHALATAA